MEQAQALQAAISALVAHLARLENRISGATERTSPLVSSESNTLFDLADRLASGQLTPGTAKPLSTPPMRSIYTQVWRAERGSSTPDAFLPLAPLALDKRNLFPVNTVDSQAYQELFAHIFEAANSPSPSSAVYLERLLSAYQRFAWSIPADLGDGSTDVSLYDQARMTAALSVCLTGAGFDPQTVPADSDEPAALLVGGDLSGIQDFIYTISSKRAAKTLRGRSFYLQLLTEAVLRFVLDRLNLPVTNVIYAGGGHFFLLAPLDAVQQLDQLQREVSRKLIRHHGISLYLAMGWAEVPLHGFRHGMFDQYWKQMHGRLNDAKLRRYSELGKEMHSLVFAIDPQGGNAEKTCSVCGEERAGVRPVGEQEDSAGQPINICPLCESFNTQIGTKLAKARYIVLGIGQAGDTTPGNVRSALREFGMTFALENQNLSELGAADKAVIWMLEDLQTQNLPALNIPSAALARYTVHQIPNELDFSDLEEKVRGGFKRLGVLRADVDGLGDLFKTGFYPGPVVEQQRLEENLLSLSRLATLSFQMTLFFEGWLKQIIQQPAYCDSSGPLIYAVYSGGDDLFLIGPWDRMPELAVNIVEDFKKYTGDHPLLHLSAGMAFIDGKYPVYQAAEDAGRALERAKGREGKNSFSFLDRVWTWEEFAELQKKKNQLVNLVRRGETDLSVPGQLLSILRQLAEEAAEHQRVDGKVLYGPWIWRGEYLLARMQERLPLKAREIGEIRTSLQGKESERPYANIDVWGYAARWAQLLVRE